VPNFDLDCGCFRSCTGECGSRDVEPGSMYAGVARSRGPENMSLAPELAPRVARPSSRASGIEPAISGVADPVALALANAERADPGNPFVASCRCFYEARGYLSDKQLSSIKRVTPTRRPSPALAFLGSDYNSSPDEYGLGNSWDWAGGD
jgi:hypothetical protein